MNYLKIVVIYIMTLFVSSAYGQKLLVRDSVYDFLSEDSIFVLPDDVSRALEARFVSFDRPREKINLSLSLHSIGIDATLYAKKEVWRHRLNDASVINFKKRNLGYTYSPRDFRYGPVGSSVMPFVRFVFGQ